MASWNFWEFQDQDSYNTDRAVDFGRLAPQIKAKADADLFKREAGDWMDSFWGAAEETVSRVGQYGSDAADAFGGWAAEKLEDVRGPLYPDEEAEEEDYSDPFARGISGERLDEPPEDARYSDPYASGLGSEEAEVVPPPGGSLLSKAASRLFREADEANEFSMGSAGMAPDAPSAEEIARPFVEPGAGARALEGLTAAQDTGDYTDPYASGLTRETPRPEESGARTARTLAEGADWLVGGPEGRARDARLKELAEPVQTGTATPEQEEEYIALTSKLGTDIGPAIVSPTVAKSLKGITRIPDDPMFREAVEAAGGKITEAGVRLNLIRAQSPAGELAPASRGGVFYEAKVPGSEAGYLTDPGTTPSVGGSERIEGPTLIRSPLVADGAGSQFLRRAAENLGLRPQDIDSAMTEVAFARDARHVATTLDRFGGDPSAADAIAKLPSPEWKFSVAENILATNARKQGFDAIVNLDVPEGGKARISEVLDLREAALPSPGGAFELRPEFGQTPAKQAVQNDLLRLARDEFGEIPDYYRERIDLATGTSPQAELAREDLRGLFPLDAPAILARLPEGASARSTGPGTELRPEYSPMAVAGGAPEPGESLLSKAAKRLAGEGDEAAGSLPETGMKPAGNLPRTSEEVKAAIPNLAKAIGADAAEDLARRIAGLASPAEELGRPGVLDYVKATTRSGLIGPTTAVTNTTSNMLNLLWDPPKEAVRALARGHPREAAAEVSGLGGDLLRGVGKAIDVIRHGGQHPDYQNLSARETNPIGKLYLKFLEKGMDAFTGAPDALFRPAATGFGERKVAAQLASDAGLKGTAWTERVAELLDEADAARSGAGVATPEAQRIVAEGKRMADRWGLQGGVDMSSGFGKAIADMTHDRGPYGWIGSIAEPFAQTSYRAMNILAERSPLGVAAKQPTRFDKVYDTVAGSLIITGAVAAASRGLVTGSGPQSRSERDMLEAQGWVPYSTLFMGQYVPNRLFGIWGPVLNAAGEIHDAMTYRKDDADTNALAQDAIRRAGRIASDFPLAGGFGEIVSGLAGAGFERAAAGYLQRATPYAATARTVATALDPTQRDPESVGERWRANIPGQRSGVAPKTDILGREVPNENTGLKALLPKLSTPQQSKTLSEFRRLGYNMPEVTDTIKGEKLPAAEARAYRTASQQLRGQLAAALIESPLYRKADDAGKEKLLKSAMGKAAAWGAQAVRPGLADEGTEWRNPAVGGDPRKAIAGYMKALDVQDQLKTLSASRFRGKSPAAAKQIAADKAQIAGYRRVLGERKGDMVVRAKIGGPRFSQAKNAREDRSYARKAARLRADPNYSLFIESGRTDVSDVSIDLEMAV